ncbi:MAG: TIR domain-containing protein [Clostridia bacterium]|nr:TIR domain-containing protein [Clostridia bacterium]
MGHKVFISYKYADTNVKKINPDSRNEDTVRNYVDKLEEYLKDSSDHIYKGESDGEDLSEMSEEAIWSTLKDRIYDSTLTIVMISPNMKESSKDRDQWIPWEISYSLKEVSRKNSSGNLVTSSSNAIIAVVVPDKFGSYSYYTYNNNCCSSPCRTLKTNTLFNILKENMFNIKNPDSRVCNENSKIYHGESSYIISVTWEDFIADPESYIDRAFNIQNSIEKYNVVKELNQ